MHSELSSRHHGLGHIITHRVIFVHICIIQIVHSQKRHNWRCVAWWRRRKRRGCHERRVHHGTRYRCGHGCHAGIWNGTASSTTGGSVLAGWVSGSQQAASCAAVTIIDLIWRRCHTLSTKVSLQHGKVLCGLKSSVEQTGKRMLIAFPLPITFDLEGGGRPGTCHPPQ